MTTPTGPVLFLKLDELGSDGTTFSDSSGNGLVGTVAQTVIMSDDPMLGACVELPAAGPGIVVDDSSVLQIPGDLTLACWVQVLAPANANDAGISLVVKEGEYGLACQSGLQAITFAPANITASLPGGLGQQLDSATFYHVVGVQRGEHARLYINGVLASEGTFTGTRQTGSNDVQIGSATGYQNPYCRLSRARIFARALGPDEVWQMYVGDQALPFRSSYPIAFDLENDQGESVLYIDDQPVGPGHTMSVQIANASELPVYLQKPVSELPSEADHHFELLFRPGTLSLKPTLSLTPWTAASGTWVISQPVTHRDRSVSIYLLCTDQDATLAPGASATIGILGLVAAAAGGSRATRVELRYGAISLEATVKGGSVEPTFPLSGSRTAILNIVNDRGKKHSPLHFGLGANHRVLNDGITANNLTFLLTNTSPDTALVLSQSPTGPTSKLLLYFDVDGPDVPKTAWALGTAANVGGCTVTAPEGLTVTPVSSPSAAIYKIEPTGGSFVIPPQGHVAISMTGLVTDYPRGQTNAYLRYEHLHGYWAQTLACPIEKSPMLFDDDQGTTDTGQGSALLDFNGSLQLRGNTIALSGPPPAQNSAPSAFQGRSAFQAVSQSQPGPYNHLALNPSGTFSSVMIGGTTFTPNENGATETPPTLIVHGGVRARGGAPGQYGGSNNGYAFHGGNGDDDSGMFCDGDGLLEFYTNASERMRIDKDGNVGIGTTTPRGRLDAAGAILGVGVYADGLFLPRPTTTSVPNNYTGNFSVDANGTLTTSGTVTAAALVSTNNVQGATYSGDGSGLSRVMTQYQGGTCNQGGTCSQDQLFDQAYFATLPFDGAVYRVIMQVILAGGQDVWGVCISNDNAAANYSQSNADGINNGAGPWFINAGPGDVLTIEATISLSWTDNVVMHGFCTREPAGGGLCSMVAFGVVWTNTSQGVFKLQVTGSNVGSQVSACAWSIYQAPR